MPPNLGTGPGRSFYRYTQEAEGAHKIVTRHSSQRMLLLAIKRYVPGINKSQQDDDEDVTGYALPSYAVSTGSTTPSVTQLCSFEEP